MKEKEKTKENAKKKNRKPTKWAGKIWREKSRVRAHLGKKFKTFHNYFKLKFNIALNGYLDKFPT